MGECMQAGSYDAFKRGRASSNQVRPDVYEEQEDQWAILKHEVEEDGMQRRAEKVRTGWEQRDTEENTIASQSSFDAFSQSMENVDIVVVGVGGGGMNAINRMINARVRGVRFVAMNTDAQVLALSQAPARICLGQHHTKGLGAGGNAAVGMRAATESAAEIRAALGEADMVFIAAGMGGGTGTGAAPVVASIAKKLGALTVGIVTLPFTFEGSRRRRIAEQGLAELRNEIDALITVPNDRLLNTASRERSLSDAFKVADDVLRQGVQGIAEVINVPGLVNVDFADVRSILNDAGTALMSIGQGKGRNRAQQAAEEAIAGGFLNVTIRGAKRVLFNISGGEDMTLFEVNEVAERIGGAIDDAADIIFGAVIDPSLTDTMRVTLIAASMEELHTTQIEAMHMDSPPMRQTKSYANVSMPTSTPRLAPRQSSLTQANQTASPSTSFQYNVPPASRPAPIAPAPSSQPVPDAYYDPAAGKQNSKGQEGPSGPYAGRQQRSLNDLRGIRSMGKRQEERS